MNTTELKKVLKDQYTSGDITFDEYTEQLVNLLVSYVMKMCWNLQLC